MAKTARDPLFDNIRGILIFLVVLGHLLERIRDHAAASTTLFVIYTFHMPAFILITGYFSRNFELSSNRLRQLVTKVLVPYLVFQFLQTLIGQISTGKLNFRSLITSDFIVPHFALWFLLALFFWRVSVPFFRQLRYPLPSR